MSFNLIPLRKHKRYFFSRKQTKASHPALLFNYNPVHDSLSQNYLGMVLDSKLNFEKHVRTVFAKVNDTIGLLPELKKTFPRQSLSTIYKTFNRPHLDCGEVILDSGYNDPFLQKLESFQYNKVLAITGAIEVLLQKGFSMN